MKEYYRHYRLYEDNGNTVELLPRGGVTLFVLQVDAEEGHSTVVVGTATCSLGDNYCRRTGRKIAGQRAHSQSRSYHFTELDSKVDEELAAHAWCAAHDVYGRRFAERVELLATGDARW